MKKENKNAARVGLFVILSVLLFMVGFYLIGNNQNMFGKRFLISTTFHSVNGLKKGNVVRFNGIDVGSISEIDFLNDSTLQVIMRIEKKVKPFIKKDATASIGSEGLVGNMLVNISPGGIAPPVEDGDVIRSYSRVDTEDLLDALGNTNENIAIISKNLLDITAKMNSGQGIIANLLENESMSDDLAGTLRHLHQTVRVLESATQQVNELFIAINNGEGMAGQILKDSLFVPTLVRSSERLDTALIGLNQLVDKTDPILVNLLSTSKKLDDASAHLDTLIQHIDRGKGAVGALLHDDLLRQDLKQTMSNLNEGTKRFSEDMEALKRNIFFRKYFKEQSKKNK